MGLSKIEWTDVVWNCVRGCTKVSPGCAHCYAETFAERWRGIPGHPYEQGFDLRLVPEKLAEPLKWKKPITETCPDCDGAGSENDWKGCARCTGRGTIERPRRVFVNSMSDLFHEDVPNDYIGAVFGVMAATPQCTYQILTKRSKRMREWFGWVSRQVPVGIEDLRLHPVAVCSGSAHQIQPGVFDVSQLGGYESWRWPLSNVWLGVSCENQKAADERIPDLLATRAAVRFISAEPLLGPIDLTHIGEFRNEPLSALEEIVGYVERPPLSWVIVGGESGPKARLMHPEWVRSLRDQCRAARVPFFFKQMTEKGRKIPYESVPADLRIRQFPELAR